MRNRSKQIAQEIKQLHGTARRDRVAKHPEAEKLNELPAPPDNLTGRGLEFYMNQGPELLVMGLLNQFNLPLFRSICVYEMELEKLSVKIDRARNISDYQRYRKMFDDACQRQRLTMQEIGLTTVRAKQHKELSRIEKYIYGSN
ncbi:MAG: hypothetical protein JXB19_00310 [Bacteroidales bacterium]|nr:hypothetical protein [Bacteroidales bacterium]